MPVREGHSEKGKAVQAGAFAQMFDPHHALAIALWDVSAAPGGDRAHDVSHILRVWRNVQRIAVDEVCDLEVLTAATLLHDCVAIEKNDPRRAQASRLSAHAAVERLRALGRADRFCDAVAHAIEAHSFSAGITPQTIEAKILQDADRLDAIGFIGVARCFYVSGRLDRALYDPMDIRASHRALDDSLYSLDHFRTKLLTLAEGFQTATGRKLAAMRHQRLLAFYEGFIEETGG